MESLKQLGFKDLSYLMNPGIYVLCLNGEVVYVGQTTNILTRFAAPDHYNRIYDKIYFIKCDLSELNRLEALMIVKLKPTGNETYNFNNNADVRNRPPQSSNPGETTINMTVMGTQLSLRGRRRI